MLQRSEILLAKWISARGVNFCSREFIWLLPVWGLKSETYRDPLMIGRFERDQTQGHCTFIDKIILPMWPSINLRIYLQRTHWLKCVKKSCLTSFIVFCWNHIRKQSNSSQVLITVQPDSCGKLLYSVVDAEKCCQGNCIAGHKDIPCTKAVGLAYLNIFFSFPGHLETKIHLSLNYRYLTVVPVSSLHVDKPLYYLILSFRLPQC